MDRTAQDPPVRSAGDDGTGSRSRRRADAARLRLRPDRRRRRSGRLLASRHSRGSACRPSPWSRRPRRSGFGGCRSIALVTAGRPGFRNGTWFRWPPTPRAVADALGVDRFAVLGASGGGPHALACAAPMPDRVLGAVSIAGLAPFSAENLAWFDGMAPAGEAELRAACAGPAVLAEHLATAAFDPEIFTPADHMALAGIWSWLGDVAGQARAGWDRRNGRRRSGVRASVGFRPRAGGACRCCSCTARRTASSRRRIRCGWRTRCRWPSCGCDRMRVTFRCWAKVSPP